MQRVYVDRLYAGLLWMRPGPHGGPEWHAEDRDATERTFDTEALARSWLVVRLRWTMRKRA